MMDRQLLVHLCDEYALGLLDGTERTELEALLAAGNDDARTQLRRSEEFVAQLALTVAPVAPPATLRGRLLASPRLQPSSAPVVDIRAGRRDHAETLAPAARLSPVWKLGWAAAAALTVASLYSYFALRATRSDLERALADLTLARGEADRSRKVLAVIFSRDARFVKLSTAEQAPTFRAFWGPASSSLVLAGASVPTPAPGRTMQLWIVPKTGNPVSAGVFVPGANGQVLLIAQTQTRIEDAAALAISDEPSGGSPQPTTKPVFVGPVGD